jgi:hypothetical protein
VGPHAKDFHSLDALDDLIDQTVLDVDSSGAGPAEFANQLLVRGRRLKWIPAEYDQQVFCLGPKAGSREFLGILSGMRRENDAPSHQSIPRLHFDTGVFIPLTIDAFMPGMLERKSVSCMARQSSSEIRTPLLLFPVIWIGSCESATSSKRE